MSSTKDEAEGLQSVITRFQSQVDGLSLAAGRISSVFGDLHPLEQQGLENALPKRRQEFATGRMLARQLLADLGVPIEPILRGARREPLWPDGITGSISHTEEFAVVGLARTRSVRTLGLDLEVRDRLSEKLYEKVFTKGERERIRTEGQQLAGPFFSAKEAGYKATFPIGGKFIGFQQAEVLLDPSHARFSFRYLGDHEPNQIMNSAEGWFLYSGPYVLSVVIIPNST